MSIDSVCGCSGTSESHDSPRDESSWSDISKQYAVYKSKTMAEKAAWDFMEELPGKDSSVFTHYI